MGRRRNWMMDRKLRQIVAQRTPMTEMEAHKQSLADTVKGCGTVKYSRAAKRPMPPENGRRINLDSPEGQAIIAKLTV